MWIINRLLGLLLLGCISINLYAQQKMEVKDFQRLKKPWLGKRTYSVNKKQATLDLFVAEEGFTFLADGKTPLELQQGEGLVTLLVPHRTRFLVVTHAKHGYLVWKAPQKPLERKKHYQATLQICDPEEEFRQQKQWAVFKISPREAIIWVDSTMVGTRTGTASFFLALGKHSYSVEAPFHHKSESEFDLDEQERKVIEVNLQPVYSYLTVSSRLPEVDILIDGNNIGKEEATSGKLMEGAHKVEVMRDGVSIYSKYITLGKAEKKRITLTDEDFHLPPSKERDSLTSVVLLPIKVIEDSVQIVAPVKIKAPTSDMSIVINREIVDTGEWEGELPAGDYALQTRKDSLESTIIWLPIRDGSKKEVNLTIPQVAYGMLNIQSNVVDAEIWINEKKMGYTPCMVKNLPAGVSCRVTLRKSGYTDASKTVVPPSNNKINITIKLKKK